MKRLKRQQNEVFNGDLLELNIEAMSLLERRESEITFGGEKARRQLAEGVESGSRKRRRPRRRGGGGSEQHVRRR